MHFSGKLLIHKSINVSFMSLTYKIYMMLKYGKIQTNCWEKDGMELKLGRLSQQELALQVINKEYSL